VLAARVVSRRQPEAGQHRPDARGREEHPVPARPDVEHLPREHGQQDDPGEAEAPDDAEEQEERAQHGLAPHVAHAVEEARGRRRHRRGARRREPHVSERDEDGDVAQRVQEKARCLTHLRDEEARDGGADHARSDQRVDATA